MVALCGTSWKIVRSRVVFVTYWSGRSQLHQELIFRNIETKGKIVSPRKQLGSVQDPMMIWRLRDQEDQPGKGGDRPPSMMTL